MEQNKLMKVLEMTEQCMCSQFDYDWEDSRTLEIKEEFRHLYDYYYQHFYNIVNNEQ